MFSIQRLKLIAIIINIIHRYWLLLIDTYTCASSLFTRGHSSLLVYPVRHFTPSNSCVTLGKALSSPQTTVLNI